MSDQSKDGWKWMPEGQPRECSGCGKTLRLTKDTILFRCFPVLESWCRECGFPGMRV